MTLPIKFKIIHISIGTIITIILFIIAMLSGILSFGQNAGGFEAEVKQNTKTILEYRPFIQQIPVMKESIKNLKDDVSYTRKGVDDIKRLLINK